MNTTERRQRFKNLLSGSRCVYPASVFDPISARIADDLGFEVGMFAGSVASMTVTGNPDLTGLTLTEFAQQIDRITRASDISLLVDADDGYGNAINTMRTVTEMERAGVCALTLEDTVLPQAFGANGAQQMTSVEEGVARMQAALHTRSDPDMVIAGRTSAAELNSVDDAINRLQAYAKAGVDALFPIGITTRSELERFHCALDLPLIVYIGNEELADLDYLASQGVRVALQAHAPFAAAVKAVFDTLSAQKAGTFAGNLANLADGELMAKVTRQADFSQWSKRFVK